MRPPCLLPLLLAAALVACDSAATAATDADRPAAAARRPVMAATQPADDSGQPVSSTPSATAMNEPADPTTATPPAPGPYRLVGVYDPGLQVVAWAMKVPRDWRVQQSYQREWNGALPSDKVYLRFTAPDGKQQIEFLPFQQYFFPDGPTQRQMHAQMKAMGMPIPRKPNELPPMSALACLRQVLLPQLAQHGLRLQQVGNELQTAATHPPTSEKGAESKASVDGVLPNGNRVRVEARLFTYAPLRNGEDVMYSWGVVPSITQTTGDLTATYAHTRAGQESLTYNPEWQRRNRDLSNRGLQANLQTMRQNDDALRATMQRNHEARMADIARAGAASTARYQERMAAMDNQMASYQATSASQDRQHEYYVDNAIRGQTKYENPGTGERVKLDNSYQYTYTDNQGHYYGTNTPINPGAVNWQELQQVTLKNY